MADGDRIDGIFVPVSTEQLPEDDIGEQLSAETPTRVIDRLGSLRERLP